jgi:hypothetical protein
MSELAYALENSSGVRVNERTALRGSNRDCPDLGEDSCLTGPPHVADAIRIFVDVDGDFAVGIRADTRLGSDFREDDDLGARWRPLRIRG